MFWRDGINGIESSVSVDLASWARIQTHSVVSWLHRSADHPRRCSRPPCSARHVEASDQVEFVRAAAALRPSFEDAGTTAARGSCGTSASEVGAGATPPGRVHCAAKIDRAELG